MTVGFVRLVPNVIILIIKLTIEKNEIKKTSLSKFSGFCFWKTY